MSSQHTSQKTSEEQQQKQSKREKVKFKHRERKRKSELVQNSIELKLMMEWVKGEIIGRGSFGTVNLATPRRDFSEIPPVMAVKSSLVSQSAMLQKEKEILTHLNGCPQILRCFGDDLTIENGVKIYNIFLEFAAKGNLSQLIKSSSENSIPESDIRRYTKSITQGLNFIHRQGYVHSDIKPQNILLCSSSGKQSEVKIADFGLAKKAGQKSRVLGLIGTPLYMSPESISCNENEAPSDVWALGCVVIEMITGKPAWNCKAKADVSNLLFRIGFSEESPEIPEELSEQGKDFLNKCLMRDPKKRWTAKMLLDHPFIATAAADDDDDKTVPLPGLEKSFPSPRSAFDFPESWNSSHLSSVERTNSDSNNSFDELNCSSSGLTDRIRDLGMGQEPNWASSDSWVVVRKTESSVS